MSAATSFLHVTPSSAQLARPPAAPTAPAIVPPELAMLFVESTKAKSTYYRLEERDRRGFVNFINLATTSVARERRAAIVATSLLGLAAVLTTDASS